MEGLEKNNSWNLLLHKVFQPKTYCIRMNDSCTYTVNDYRQKLFFFFYPHLHVNCVAPPCFSASHDKAFAYENYRQCGQKKKAFAYRIYRHFIQQCTPQFFFTKHKNKAEFKGLHDSKVLSSDFPGLKTSAASMTSVASTVSMASMTSTASFHQKIY